MKTLKLIIAGIFLFVSNMSHSQVSVNVNIGTPPSWGPAGYSNVDYYFLPDIQAYYDIRAAQYIYISNGNWHRSRYLPRAYRNYDLYNGYKVVLTDYHGSKPYTYYNNHRAKYYLGYKGNPQKTIGMRPNYHGNNGNHYGNNRNGNENRDRGNRGNENRDHGNRGNGDRDHEDRGRGNH